MSNVLVVEASPRKKGNSCTLAEQAVEGLREAGAKVETLWLPPLKIHPCVACEKCAKSDHFCVQKDDMCEIYPKLVAADGMILAAPIYWYNFNAQLKIFIDRWYALWNQQRNFMRGKPIGVILTYGDENLYSSGVINAIHTFESIFRGLGAEAAGWVFGTMNDVGEAQQNPDLMSAARELVKKVAEKIR